MALRAFRRGATAVAAMIASVGAVCDLDLVVIGGGVAKSGTLLFDPLREALGAYAGWTSSAACGWCPPNSAATPAWSARRPCCAIGDFGVTESRAASTAHADRRRTAVLADRRAARYS